MFPLRKFLTFAVAGAIFALSAATHSPYAEILVALSALTSPASADEMVQNLWPVPAHEPILKTVGNKHVIAFFESRGFTQRCELALALRADGAGVTLFLVENGVLAARRAARLRELDKLAKAGVKMLADEFALRERGVGSGELDTSVMVAGLDAVVGELAAGAKALWN